MRRRTVRRLAAAGAPEDAAPLARRIDDSLPDMSLPWPLLWLIDPAGAYWSRRMPRNDGPTFHRGAVFGPDVPGGARQATEREIAAMAAAAEPDAYERSIDEAERRWAPELRRAAEHVLAEGAARFELNGRTVEVRVVRFWRGDSLLETSTTGPDGDSESRTRIDRDAAPDQLVWYLARATTKG
jgi:hypothetical protein